MKRPAWLARLCAKREAQRGGPPLAAQLENPYSPVFGKPRRFEELVRPERQPPAARRKK